MELDGVVEVSVVLRVDRAIGVEVAVGVVARAGELDVVVNHALILRIDQSVEIAVADVGVLDDMAVSGVDLPRTMERRQSCCAPARTSRRSARGASAVWAGTPRANKNRPARRAVVR